MPNIVGNLNFYINRGEAKRAQRKIFEALQDFDLALEIDSKCGKAWGCKGVALYQIGDEIESIKCLKKAIKLDSEEPFYLNVLGCISDKQKDAEKAEEYYNKALDINPYYHHAISNLGELRKKQKRYDEAMKFYNLALKIESKIDSAWIGKGQIQFINGNYDDALICFNRALQINPSHAVAWNEKGLIYVTMNNLNNAEKCFSKAIECDLKFPDPYNNMAEIQRRKGNLEEAISFSDKSMSISEDAPSHWTNRGAILANMNKNEEALFCFEKALQIDLNLPDAINNKIGILILLGRFKDAEEFANSIDVDTIGPGGIYLKTWDVYVPGEQPRFVESIDDPIKITEFIEDIIQSSMLVLRGFQSTLPLYVKQYHRDGTSLRETDFRDDFKARCELKFNEISAECKIRDGFTDLRIQNQKNPLESIIFEFKIWGRNDYKDVIDQLIGYLTSFETCGIIIMINVNKTSINNQYKEKIIMDHETYVEDSLKEKPISGLGNLVHYNSDHIDVKGNRIRIFHFIIDIW